MAKTLKDAVAEIIEQRMRAGIVPIVRAVVGEVLKQEFGLEGAARRPRGRPPKSARAAGVAAAPKARPGRRSKLTVEQKRARAAAYQRQYRRKQKAAKAKAAAAKAKS
jgi:hypothetical protein